MPNSIDKALVRRVQFAREAGIEFTERGNACGSLRLVRAAGFVAEAHLLLAVFNRGDDGVKRS